MRRLEAVVSFKRWPVACVLVSAALLGPACREETRSSLVLVDGTEVSCDGVIYQDGAGYSCVGDVGATGSGRATAFTYDADEVDHVVGEWIGETG